jgi:hypothetical protein
LTGAALGAGVVGMVLLAWFADGQCNPRVLTPHLSMKTGFFYYLEPKELFMPKNRYIDWLKRIWKSKTPNMKCLMQSDKKSIKIGISLTILWISTSFRRKKLGNLQLLLKGESK